MLIFGRVLLGVGVGFANQAVPFIIQKWHHPSTEEGINNSFQLSVGIGVLIANLINYGTEKVSKFTGIQCHSAFYAPILFRTIGPTGESAALLSAVVTGAVGIATTAMSMLIVDKVGRESC
ncbi:hypothetical protein HAX54_007189 [Datura stramonium]|uniref:Major facilitator superfamily (MFS) profile domain-containing protein n=1 Tax=Datura stramonium TaxID=4076 RepID=A0ABS8TD57_DATST|nr:hypothetical protein [Datura stramonium]